MIAPRPIPPDTLNRQAEAADPRHSVWVSANAGSGKTHVLAHRVVRLLLDGVPPSKILCLTFTKAAAAEMSMRVFDTLAAWTRCDDAELADRIAATGARRPAAASPTLVFARRLFARTVETPGGLKIQTIHALCERLLHLFPFEANVAADFSVVDELREAELLAASRRAVIDRAVHDDDGPLGQSLRLIAAETGARGFDVVLREAMGHRFAVRLAGEFDWRQRLAAVLGVEADATPARVDQHIIDGGLPPRQWEAVAAALERGSVSDADLAGRLRRAAARAPDRACLADYLSVFLTQKGTPRGLGKTKMVTAALQKREPDLLARLEAERDRILALGDVRRAAATLERTVALITLSDAILADYAARKNRLGLLDFDDLIERTKNLLTRSDAAWVLYKLDAGIDHILVDEAQDTSADQWSILSALADDFTSGLSARTGSRTFFAVGDEKQSIYSFQGAEPLMFDRMRRTMHSRHVEAERAFTTIDLQMSFRSSRGILEPVDAVFGIDAHYRGLSADNVATVHTAWKAEIPGSIEVWDPVGPTVREDPRDWALPLDAVDDDDPPAIVAKRVSQTIARWLAPHSNESVHDDKLGGARPLRAADILILVRTRGPFFGAVIRALKEAGVPVAGADRLDLAQHIAVIDLVAAGRASLLPDDDLTVASLLKSPLIGLDDDDLIALAPKRPGSLASALAASMEARHRQAAERLADWRLRARCETPFVFYARLLGEGRGRHDLVARLGPEAADAIDEFLRLALAHQRDETPSLSNFLATLQDANLSIRRDMDPSSDAVRVMTVHAAKGLEAKVVFLPDTCGKPSGSHDPRLFHMTDASGPLLAWSPRKSDDPPPVVASREAYRRAEEDEHRRLLYVAMTRAEERLIVAGFHGAQGRGAGCWYDMIARALDHDLAPAAAPWGDKDVSIRRRVSHGHGLRAVAAVTPADAAPPRALPAWLRQDAAPERDVVPPLRPSNALATADADPVRAIAPSQRESMESGRLTHALLQHLPDVPAVHRHSATLRYLVARAPAWDAVQRTALAARVLAVLDHPACAALFGPGSRGEVPIIGRISRDNRAPIAITGRIDRLAETADAVWIADFKAGPARKPPAAYVLQLALYRAVIAALYPSRPVRAMLVWTDDASVTEIEAAALNAALDSVEV